MGGEVLKITISRKDKHQSWGFKIIGGVDVGLVLKVLRIVGVDTPAYESGLQEHDVIVSVGEELVTLMTHQQVVDTIRRVTGTSLELTVQRGDHIVPSLAECFPAGDEISEEELQEFFSHAAEHGVGSRLVPKYFTTVGKFKVKTPKYNCPVDLYSETTMDEMVGGSMPEEEKLDPNGPAYKKWKASKKFDPSRSEVLAVMRAQEAGGPRRL